MKAKHAVTLYEVLEEYEFASLLKINLKTGRTHQIRVHLSSINHPVFGDANLRWQRNCLWIKSSENDIAEQKICLK